MLKIAKEKIVQKIQAQADISTQEIEERIQKKLKELAGLISEEGAAHIIANELGVTIFDDTSDQPIKIGDILPGMRNVKTAGKIMQVYPITTFTKDGGEGKVQAIVIADDTGSIRCAAWHSVCDVTQNLQQGDIVALNQVMSRSNQGRVELSINDPQAITVNPEGVAIENVSTTQTINAKPILIKDVDKDSGVISMFGTVVQAYPPTFYVPRANRVEGKEYTDEEKTDCVGNIVLDDGTESIRIALFNDTLTEMCNAAKQDLKNKELWPETKKKLLGTMLMVNGRAIENTQFNRQEVIASSTSKVDAEQAKKLLQQLYD